MPSLTGEKCRSPSTICQTPTCRPSRWTAALGISGAAGSAGKSTVTSASSPTGGKGSGFVIECHLGKRFLGYRVGLGFHLRQHATFSKSGHHANAGRYEPAASQPSPDALIWSKRALIHKLWGRSLPPRLPPATMVAAGIGIAHGDYTVDRRDQAQIALRATSPSRSERAPGNIFLSGG